MHTKPLYVLVADGGDGSYYPKFTLDPDWIDRQQARCECWDENENGTQMEDFYVYHCSASNVADAHAGGICDGGTQLARPVLTAMGVSWSEADCPTIPESSRSNTYDT